MELRFWKDPETGLPRIFDHDLTEEEVRQVLSRTGDVSKEMTRKKTQPLPVGWDEERVQRLAEHYDNQSEAEQAAEHEAAFLAEGQTVMVVPTELVPEIVKLISKKRPA